MNTGPNLTIGLYGHSMASIGNGQAILGGQDSTGVFQDSIYYMTCSQKICMVMTLHQKLSVPRADFVAFMKAIVGYQ